MKTGLGKCHNFHRKTDRKWQVGAVMFSTHLQLKPETGKFPGVDVPTKYAKVKPCNQPTPTKK